MVKLGILAGGLGSRLSEESVVKPKPPMVEIGDRPILWHIMNTDFAVALGYKGEYIKRWFADRAGLTAFVPGQAEYSQRYEERRGSRRAQLTDLGVGTELLAL